MSSDAQAHAQNAWFILGLMRSRVVGKRTKYARVSGSMRLLTGTPTTLLTGLRGFI